MSKSIESLHIAVLAGGPGSEREVSLASAKGVVGALEGQTYVRETLALRPGDVLVLYTDGVTEAFNEADQLYGEDRLDRRLGALPADASAAEILRGVVADVAAFAGAREQSDDITLLVLRYGTAGTEIS